MLFIYISLISIVAVWLIGFIFRTDFSVPTKSLSTIGNVLVIFPHPDDEAMTVSGVIHELSKQHKNVTLLVLSKGERGTPDGSIDPKLKDIRTKEMEKVSKILGVTKLIHKDYGDGQIIKRSDDIKIIIDATIKEEQPDVVITYDQSGLYGHEDHIVVSDIVTNLIQTKYTAVKLWYVTYPKRILTLASLPEHMAKNPEFKNKRTTPTTQIFIGSSIIQKIQAIYAYKSQFESFRKSYPFRPIPLWFMLSMSLHEYFYEVK